MKVTDHYAAYLDDYLRRHPQVPGESYQSASDRMHGDAYAWADFYARNLRALGVEAFEIVGNAEWIQQTWAREHGVSATGKELVLLQLLALKPEVLFIQSIGTYDKAFVAEARRRIPSLKLVLGWCCAPHGPQQKATLEACDGVLTCTPGFLTEFKEAGHQAWQLNHAFESTLIQSITEAPAGTTADAVFSGSFFSGKELHDERGKLVERLLIDGFDLRLFGNLLEEHPVRTRIKEAARVAAGLLKRVGLAGVAGAMPPLARAAESEKSPSVSRFLPALKRALRPPRFGRQMYQALHEARVGLNTHGGITPRFAGNMRLFECTGVGTCLLTDWKENLGELFAVDTDVATFRSVAECAEKLGWLLEHEQGRVEIAASGKRRTLAAHTFAHRAVELDAIVRERL